MIRAALLYHIYSGHLFFTAVALFAIGVVVPKLRLLALLAVPLAAFSGTPVPWPILVLLVLGVGGYFVSEWRTGALACRDRRGRLSSTIALIAVAIALAFELPWHFVRRVPAPTRLFVIGDSVASGGFGPSSVPWPQRLGAVNLARPSELAATAPEQLTLLPSAAEGDTVLVEIGGNDMLEGRPIREYRDGLETVLRGVQPRRVVMLELPLVPGAWRYGAIQRSLARKYGVVLLPKRLLAGVLTDPRNTIDGLHLNERGDAEMSREIAHAISRGKTQ